MNKTNDGIDYDAECSVWICGFNNRLLDPRPNEVSSDLMMTKDGRFFFLTRDRVGGPMDAIIEVHPMEVVQAFVSWHGDDAARIRAFARREV